ncbi:MAG: glycosyltransferase family 1 protein [Bacteroidales bacterium]|nr:glycosyltransferase family 1 protein [Bacteroidales bacterium]
MTDKQREIHLVSFNVPFPANYGGVIDVFYKIKALKGLGIQINLHCFNYSNRESTEELEKYCKSVTLYPRLLKRTFFLSTKPFIVRSRSNRQLLYNLEKDNLPILFEGLHSTYFLKKISEKGNRNIIVRAHNIEHKYYFKLAAAEKNIIKKIYLYSEGCKLKNYEKILKSNISIAAITESDKNYFSVLNSDTFYIPAFHSFKKINSKIGLGDYILYHGDLSVSENIKAAEFIAKNICSKLDHKFIFAGRNPHKRLYDLSNKNKNIKIIANPDDDEMNEIIQNAHINLLLTFQDTGIKLKLINSLFNGRFCIANNTMIKNSGLESLCIVKDSLIDIITAIEELIATPFELSEINKREQILLKNVNNELSAQKLINLLFKK